VLRSQHAADGHAAFIARDRSRWRKHILVIDHYVPQFDRDAGSRTIFAYLKMFVDAGLQVASGRTIYSATARTPRHCRISASKCCTDNS
jgi:hypothetical protein